MKQKPWSLVVLAILHILAPFGNLIINAFKAGRSLSAQWQYWMNVIPLPLLFIYIAVPIIAGILIYVCRRWSYWGYLACLTVIFVSNFFSFWTQVNWISFGFLVVVLIADIIVVAYFVVPSVQKVYLDPRLRWWEAAPRYHLDAPGTANSEKCFFKNLGQGGLLIVDGPELKEGDLVDTAFQYLNKLVRIPGIIVYAGTIQGKASHGVKFLHSNETQETIRWVVDDLDSNGKIVKERMPGPDDSFAIWLKRLFTTGKGLFPAVK